MGGGGFTGLARHDAADGVDRLAGGAELRGHCVGGADDRHADAHVERAVGLLVAQVGLLDGQLHDGRHVPRARIDRGVECGRQHAVEVLGDAAAGDVGHAVDGQACGQGRQDRLHVDTRRLEQGVGQALAAQLVHRLEVRLGGTAVEEHAAGERVAVGVQTARREAQHDVALLHHLGQDHLGPVDDAHAEAAQVVVVGVHDAGVLGRLAADERAARLQAALGDAAHDGRDVLGLDVADGDVVEEEQRLGARGEQVVGAHGHQVDAHGVVAAEQLGELELGAHAVGARDEHGVVHLLDVGGGEQAAETAQAADDLRAVGGGDALLHQVDRAGALGRVDTGVAVGYLLLLVAHC